MGHLWNVWLKFEDSRDEAEYRATRSRATVTSSRQTHAIALVLLALAFLAGVLHRDHLCESRLCAFYDYVIVPALIVYLNWYHGRSFRSGCDWMLILAAAVFAMSVTLGSRVLGQADSHSVFGVINHIFTSSPLSVMTMMGIAQGTSVHDQLIGQVIFALMSRGWVSACCRGKLLPGEANLSDRIGWSFETYFGGLGTMLAPAERLSRSDGEVFPCWMVAGYFHYAVGLVLPCAMRYMFECYGRAKFLVHKFHPNSHEYVWRHFWNAFWFSFFMALTALVSGWMVFRLLAI